MRTEALVTTPTSFDQDGNGSRKTKPIRAEMTIDSSGTFRFAVTLSNASGM